MKLRFLALLAPVALGACLSVGPADDQERTLRLGESGRLGLITLRPIQVVEDSRCAVGTQCVWAGRLRLRAEVATPSGRHERTLTLGEQQQITGGTLDFKEASPRPREGQRLNPGSYRFLFHYRMPPRR